jgi:hypothetical protein
MDNFTFVKKDNLKSILNVIMTSARLTESFFVTDIELSRARNRDRENAAEKAIAVMGDVLNNADSFLTQLESNDMLATSILRRCQDLADLIGNLAGEMEGQSYEEKRLLAQACILDANVNASQELSQYSEFEMIDALSGAQTLMRDVEASLRSINRNDADEISDVALTLARLFVLSLKSMQSSITPENLLQNEEDKEFSSRIELIDDDQDLAQSDMDSSRDQEKKTNRKTVDHVRVLWPPLGPAVVNAARWGKEEAAKRPLLAVALGLTLWPAAIMTTLIGAPIVIADKVVQHVYDSFSNGPIIQTAETGAAHLYHAGRLSFLCSGLVIRQTLRVASKQVERNGGVGKLAQNVGGAIIDRVVHPVETASLAWNGLCFGAETIRAGVNFVQETVERNREGRNAAMTL